MNHLAPYLVLFGFVLFLMLYENRVISFVLTWAVRAGCEEGGSEGPGRVAASLELDIGEQPTLLGETALYLFFFPAVCLVYEVECCLGMWHCPP